MIIPKKQILNTAIACLPFEEQIMLMLRWAKARESRMVCLANVHMLMEAYWNLQFQRILQKGDLVTPDGRPLVWMLRKLEVYDQDQVAGMDVFLNLCELAQQCQVGVYFVGSSLDILEKIRDNLERDYPILPIAGMETLPFLSIKEIVAKQDPALIERINRSGAGLILVCLGCPKQEIWMAQHLGKIQGVMVGVGAAFSMYAGKNRRAPCYLQQAGLEWLYRLLQEPRRLWWRYGKTIPPFIYLAIKQLLTPCKKKFKEARQKLSENNLLVDLENLDFSSSRIGEILVRQNLLSKECLEQALWKQQQEKQFSNLKIGQILVRNHHLSLHELKFYLKNQKIKLGEILVEKKLLKQRELKKILDLQKNKHQKLGEIIVERNILSKEKLQTLLMEQYWRRKGLGIEEKEDSNLVIEDSVYIRESGHCPLYDT